MEGPRISELVPSPAAVVAAGALLLLATGQAMAAVCPTDGGVHGTVRSLSGQPVAGAAVTLTTSSATAVTSVDGRYCLHPVAVGEYRLVVYAEGYGIAEQGFRIEDREPVQLDVQLRPAFGAEVVISATRTERAAGGRAAPGADGAALANRECRRAHPGRRR